MKKHFRRKTKLNLGEKSGMTLVELMVAVAILAVVLTSALELFFYCSALSEDAGNMMFAMEEAQSKMEEVRRHTYTDILADYDTETFNLTRPSGATGEISIAEVGAEVANDLLQVTITVTWKNKNNREHNKDLISMIAKR